MPIMPDDQFDQALRHFRDTEIPDGPPPELVSHTLESLRQQPSHSPRRTFLERIRTMPPMLRIAAAVLVAASATGLFNVLTTSHTEPNAAFADFLHNVRAARAVTYTQQIGDDLGPFHVSWMESGLFRIEMPGGQVSIMDPRQGKSLMLDPARKEAVFLDGKANLPAAVAENQIDRLRDFQGKPDELLGEKQIDGRPAQGYRLSAGPWSSVVWVDSETNLPVRMESDLRIDNQTKTVVLDHFNFDPALDESVFSLTPPQGYKVQKLSVPIDQVPPNEQDLVDLFADYAKRSGGRFPADLQMPSLMDVLDPKELEVNDDGRFNEATSAWMNVIGKGLGLVWAMPPTANATYTGKGVTLGQAEKPIFFYRPEGAETYRVIHGDLSVKDVAADKLPD